MKMLLTSFSLKRPRTLLLILLAITAMFVVQYPKVHFDNDPENMLAEDEYVRVFHKSTKEKFDLYDFVIVGVVNEEHPDGVFNVGTLGRVYDLTYQLSSLEQNDDGVPVVSLPPTELGERKQPIDMTPDGAWSRILNVAFRHEPNRLFDEEGNSAVIAREIISPSVVDNLRQAELGALKQEYLMEQPPVTVEEALRIRDDAMSNPLYKGTLVAEDGKALCVYIPLEDKTFSYNAATLVRRITSDWPEEDQVHIAGLPVAEDTFGIEMLVQMATSAPLAGLAIFILLLIFFRRVSLIIAPMIVAVLSVLCTMGLLIWGGWPVHIMSSMIAIFLMPIAVADSVHILSEFHDVYHRFGDKAEAVRHVIGHLFVPMFFTSLTTMVGFGSLMLTPIPPVKVFGFHVAFGVGLAWLLTMTLIPAYIMVFVPEKSLAKMTGKHKAEGPQGGLNRAMESLGRFSYAHWKLIMGATALVLAVALYGVTRINVNDNPVKWFTRSHEIRIADKVLNEHFGGTYTAYLALSNATPDVVDWEDRKETLSSAVESRFQTVFPAAAAEFTRVVDALSDQGTEVRGGDENFAILAREAQRIDEKAAGPWNVLADEINYLDPQGLDHAGLVAAVTAVEGVGDAVKAALTERLADAAGLSGDELMDSSLAVCDEFAAMSFREFVFEMEAELTAPVFKRPAVLNYVEQLQEALGEHAVVGKTSSAVDALKKASYELKFVAPPADASADELARFESMNMQNYALPDSARSAGEVFTVLEDMKKRDSIFHLVTKNYEEANVWVQLTSGDNTDMQSVVDAVEKFMDENPPPAALSAEWAGLTYLNVVWQDKMVKGMLYSLLSSFVIVLIMMMVLFRSPLYGILSMIPLVVTILFIYGIIGIVGKDYDMPVAVLSALTLGLSVDFAIHFLQRARELRASLGSWQEAAAEMFKEPAMAISRNAITISIGFTPLLLAPLVPYRTVGFFMATIMAVSWLATLFILAAMVTALQGRLFKKKEVEAD